MPLNSLLVRSFWVGSTKRRMMRMVSEMVNSMIFGTSSSAIVLPSEDALTNQTTTISNTLNDHQNTNEEEEVMNDSLSTNILPHYRYLYQFYVPTSSLSSIRAQLESSIRGQLAQYFDNSNNLNATLTLKPSTTCDPSLQVPSKSIEKYRFDPDYVPNRSASSADLLKLDLIYSVQLLKSPSSSQETSFLRTFGHIRAFTRFTLSHHLLPLSDDQTTNIRAINDNFLNFCSTTELDFDAAYSRLRQFGEESVKVGTLIRVIEDQLDRFTDKEICLSFNGGKDCTVLLHALVTILYHRGFKVSGDKDSINKDQKNQDPNNQNPMNKDPNNPNPSSPLLNLLYIKTCEPFPEQDLFVRRVTNFYRCRLVTYTNVDTKSALFDVKRDQPALTGIFMGVRRSDLPESVRSKLQTVQLTDTDRGWPEFTRLSPLLDWTYSDVWHFITRLSVPYCSLYDYGYTSIGDPHNTIPNETLKKVIEGTQESYYLPAFVLDQEHTERNSRV